MPTIGINDFVRRQTPNSEFTHFEDESGGDRWSKIAALAAKHFNNHRPGYREGVVLVSVPSEHFFTGVVVLQEGDRLVGEYKARRSGEEPRKTTRAVSEGRTKTRCAAVDVVLYRRDVLAEGDEATTDCEWEIVSVNGHITGQPAPIEPMTLIANHFQLDGGTSTKMSPTEFEAALRESVLYWKDKAFLDSRP